jgi:two-component system, OmpR family, response regulator
MQTNLNNRNRKLRVLVVDDYRDSADALAWVLKNIGHEVRAAYDAASAVLAFDELSPDLVFQDLVLPGKSGLEIARDLRKRGASQKSLLVAMSGQQALHPMERVAFDHFIRKPVGLAELTDVLARAHHK